MTNTIHFRFKEARAPQIELMQDVFDAVNNGNNLVAHAPTGLGKTDAVLSPTLEYAKNNKMTVFFLTPTTAQHQVALETVNGLNKEFDLNLKALDLVGKPSMCLTENVKYHKDGFYEFCNQLKKNNACEFYSNLIGFDEQSKEIALNRFEKFKKEIKTNLNHLEMKKLSENFTFNGKEYPLCPYEASLMIGKNASLVIGDYNHIFNKEIQKSIFSKINATPENSILIIDEAHNLQKRIRNMVSSKITDNALTTAIGEAKELKNNELVERLKKLKTAIRELIKANLSLEKKETLIEKNDLIELLDFNVEDIINDLTKNGFDFLELNNEMQNSQLIAVSRFLKQWNDVMKSQIRIAKLNESKIYSLEIKVLDPSIITKEIFEEFHSSILMSGTLQPTEMYQEIYGLNKTKTILKEYSSTFPKENKENIIVPITTTRFSERHEEQFKEIAKMLEKTIKEIPGNVIVFFPSFKLLNDVRQFVKEPKRILLHQPKMNATQRKYLLKEFKRDKEKGNCLFSVCSGNFSEGIDYMGDELIASIIVGIPFETMNLETKKLIEYFEKKFHKGEYYAYIYPAISKAIQAGGRVIRSETDRGITLFLDERYAWGKYNKCFPKNYITKTSKDPVKEIKKFWEIKK